MKMERWLFFDSFDSSCCSIPVKHTWHTCENAMNLSNSCDNVITYANLKTIFKAKRAQIMELVCVSFML